MTNHIATIKIALKEKDATDGILERISDLASDHGAEDDGSSLAFVMTGDNQNELREDAAAFEKAVKKFFKDAATPANIYITYSEETT
jgi:hypothetical protein